MTNFNEKLRGLESRKPLKLVFYLQQLDKRLGTAIFGLVALSAIPTILFSDTPQLNISLFLIYLIPMIAGLALMPVSKSIRKVLKEHDQRTEWQDRDRML